MRRSHYASMAAVIGVIALTVAGVAVATDAMAEPLSRVALADTAYQSSYGLIDKGPAATDTTVTDNIYLSVRDPAALAARAKSVSSPGTASYGRYLTPAQSQAANQLDPAQVAQIRAWLTSAGLTVTQPNWRELTVNGTLGQLANAFDVTYDDYYDPNAEDPYHYLLPTTDLSVPGDLGNLVLDVGTSYLSRLIPSQNAALAKKDGAAAAAKAANAAKATVNLPAKLGGVVYPHADANEASSSSAVNCSQYWNQSKATELPSVNGSAPPNAVCGYTPAQLRHAYGLDSSKATGKGQTVAVVTPAMDTLEQDVNTWSENVGTRKLRSGQLTVVPTPDGSTPLDPSNGGFGAMVENTMDVEAVHGMAPDADIVSVGVSTAEGGTVFESLAYILDHTHASIASLSLATSVTPGMRKTYDQVFQEGALQGVGFYFASGDSGDRLSDLPGSWATAVGGTSLAIGANGSREFETGWGDERNLLSADGTSWQQPTLAAGGAGGGWLAGEPQPWYQHGVVPANLETGPDGKIDRVGPDISMDADGTTGYLVGGTPLSGLLTGNPTYYAQFALGGTSLSTPLFAGVQALAQQVDGGKPLGFANPEIYQRAHTPAIRDVTPYTLPDGAAPVAVRYRAVNGVANTPVLYTMVGHGSLLPGDASDMVLPRTGPGYDTETGVGTPTGAYLRSFGHD